MNLSGRDKPYVQVYKDEHGIVCIRVDFKNEPAVWAFITMTEAEIAAFVPNGEPVTLEK